jgi:hypothetical protein
MHDSESGRGIWKTNKATEARGKQTADSLSATTTLGFFAFGRAARHAFKIEQSAKLAPDWHPAASLADSLVAVVEHMPVER